jgi:PEP-CTERM motif
MKGLIYCSLLVLLPLLCLPATSDAFSRRSKSSEVAPVTTPIRATTTETNGGNNGTNGSAAAVPEPPVLLLMTVGVGLFGLSYAVRRTRKQT